MIDAVIFDMDGTMFDTERVWATLWAPALAKFGLALPAGLDDAARGTAGANLAAVIARYCPTADPWAVMAELFRLADETFARHIDKKPGLDALLAWLQARHIPMAVASSSKQTGVARNLQTAGVADYFTAVVGGDQVARSKPEPDIFLHAAALLGADPARTLVLEDSFNGVRAGAAGGFVTVMVPDMAQPTPEIAGLCRAVCPDLYAVLERLNAMDL